MEPYPDVRIVLSTTWVRVRGFTRARKALPPALQNRVVGSTWHSKMGRGELDGIRLPSTWWDRATRYQQIAAYISRAKSRINWLAIDDDGLGWPDEYVWNSAQEARAFLVTRHAMLEGQSPLDVSMSELGARHVEELLWHLFCGIAA